MDSKLMRNVLAGCAVVLTAAGCAGSSERADAGAYSERRADAVRDALVDRNIGAQRIRSMGLGESYPVASNDSDAGMQQNRRVEIVISDERGAFPDGAQRTASVR